MRFFSSLLVPVIICSVMAVSGLAQSMELTKPDSLHYPILHFNPPQAERFILPNGMVIYVLEDHELPLVNIYAAVKTGSYFDPEGKEGLAELTGLVMRTGGTKTMSGSAIDEILDALAINISITTQMESCTVSFSSLKNNLDKGVQTLSQIMKQPAFADDKLQLAKNLKMEELRRLDDNPQQLTFREFNRVLYRGNPRGRIASLASVETISRRDLEQFHRQYFGPHHTMIAITGDITQDEALQLLKKYYGDWQAEGLPTEIAPPTAELEGGMYYISKSIPQSVIVTGRYAPAKKSPDFFPFTVLDFTLGSGGFNSHIFQEIRTDQGLAYSAGSFYRARTHYGIFGTYAMTKSSSTARVVSLLHSIIEKATREPFQAKALAMAKKSLNNSFIFSFSSPEQIARQQLMLEFDQLPRDYLTTYQDNINKVTRTDMHRVAKKYLSSGLPITLVVGNDKAFDQPLTTFGPVVRLQVKDD